MALFEGVGTALITPFDENEDINYKKLEYLINRQIEDGVDALIICGTTGESATLSEEEHLDVIREAVKIVSNRIPVIAGSGSNSTKTAIEMSKKAEEAGVDGLLVVSPYYNKSTQQGLYEHYSIIAESVKLPIILYNVPGRTGINIEPETIYRLARDVKNIVGVKEATGNISQSSKIASLTRELEDFSIYSGNDDQIVPICSLGGKGVISVASHIIPRQVRDMVMCFRQGDVERALELQNIYLDLMNALFIEVNPIPVKEALNMLGYEVGGYRRPLIPMSSKNRELLKNELIKVGLI